MKIFLYSKPPSNENTIQPIATIELRDGKVVISAERKKLKQELEELFSNTLVVKEAKEGKSFRGIKLKVCNPSTKEFFEEIVYLFRKENLYAYLEK